MKRRNDRVEDDTVKYFVPIPTNTVYVPGCRVVALFWVRPNHHEQPNGEQKGWEQCKLECTSSSDNKVRLTTYQHHIGTIAVTVQISSVTRDLMLIQHTVAYSVELVVQN